MAANSETAKSKRKPVLSTADKDNLRWLWANYIKKKSKYLVLILGLISLQGFIYQQFLSFTENGLRVIFEHESFSQLLKACAVVMGLFFVRGMLSYIIPRISAWIASDSILALRNDLIDHLLTLDLTYFEQTKVGDIILRLVNQADAMATFVGQATVNAMRDGITIVIVSGYLIYKSPILFTAAILVIPSVVLLMQFVSARIKVIQATAENAFGAYINTIEEFSNGMRTVKITGQEQRERERLKDSTTGIRNLQIRLQAVQALVEPSIDFMSAFVYALVIGGGGYLVLTGADGMDAAGIITFLLGLVLLFDPARMLAQYFAQLQLNLVMLASIRSVHKAKSKIVDKPDAVTDFNAQGDIVFDDVSFAYDGKDHLFDKLNLHIPGGKTTAIVGATGSGKTTVLSLIARLYDVTDGKITVDGTDIRDIKIKSLRSSFAMVAQDIVIFNDTIRENVRYARPEATDEEIDQAIEAAELGSTVAVHKDETVGPKGAKLSGGQKQRIAIARALLKTAPVVFFDEATSALDQRTEDKIQRALAAMSTGKTRVIISHRLSAVVEADVIYVMDNGVIVERGTHDELVEGGGLYEAMFEAQRSSFK